MILAEKKPVQFVETASHLETARQPRRSRTAPKRNQAVPRIIVVLIVFLGFATLLSLTSTYAIMAMIGYEITGLKQQISTMQTENKKLELKMYQLKSLDRIEQVATNKLGMIKPDRYAYIMVDTPEKSRQVEFAQGDSGKKVADKRNPLIQAVTNLLTSKEGGYSQEGA